MRLALSLLVVSLGVGTARADHTHHVDVAIGGQLTTGEETHGGGGGRLGFLRAHEYNSHTICQEGLEGFMVALLTMGLACVPTDATFGNQRGVAVTADIFNGRRWMLGLAPQFRTERTGRAWRGPSILQLAIPEIGVLRFDDTIGPTLYLRTLRLPFTIWGRRAGIELEPAVLYVTRGETTVEGSRPIARFWMSVRFVTRQPYSTRSDQPPSSVSSLE